VALGNFGHSLPDSVAAVHFFRNIAKSTERLRGNDGNGRTFRSRGAKIPPIEEDKNEKDDYDYDHYNDDDYEYDNDDEYSE
jgi:hypothetical protein